MTEADKKLVIRNATMEDLFEVAAVEAECFPAAEAATEAEFRERIACYGGHFWLLFEDERLCFLCRWHGYGSGESDG